MNTFHQVSLLPEARSLIEVLSRLAPINAVVDDSTPSELPISICFEDDEAFRPFIGLVKSFKGNLRWLPISKLPYTCVVPSITSGPSHAVRREQARAMAIEDIRALTEVAERELNLSGVASKGVTIRQAPSSSGQPGPGGPALLVADPRKYLSGGLFSTSKLDRTVHYWISDEEGDLMYERLHPSHGTPSEGRDTPLLARVCESKYGDLVILPSEVRSLRDESQRMANSWTDLRAALDRIARICDMAAADGLGIVVLGQ